MSWETVELGNICDITNGSTPLRSNADFWENGKINWFTIEDIRRFGRQINQTTQFVTEKALKETSLKLVPPNTVLLCCTASVGEYAITKIPLTMNQQFNGLILKTEKVLPEFLFHYCSTLKEKLISVSGSTTINFVAISKLKKITIPLPPLATQQKIVSKLDAIFAEIDRATAAAEANAKNAEELFSQVLNNLENEYEGTITDLGGCVDLLSGFAFKSNEYTNIDTDIPLLRGDNLNPQIIDFSEVKRLEKGKYDEYIKYSLNVKDIVLGMDRPLISSGLRIAQVQAKNIPSLLVQRVMRMRCKKHVDSDFLFFLLNSPKFIKHLLGEQTGLGVPHISGKTISSFTVKIPKLEHQKAIVSKLNSIVTQLNRYKLANKKILSNWTSYKQSILKQAFSGELVKD